MERRLQRQPLRCEAVKQRHPGDRESADEECAAAPRQTPQQATEAIELERSYRALEAAGAEEIKPAQWPWPMPVPNTNGSQFFIMHVDYPLPPSYTIFGRVTEGTDIVNAIATSETDRGRDRPVSEVKMEKVSVA